MSITLATRHLGCPLRQLDRHVSQTTTAFALALPKLSKSSTQPIHPASHTQTQHLSTLRRQKKSLNIPPHPAHNGPPPTPTGGSGRSHRPRSPNPLERREGDTIVYNPPSSAPNVYHTPAIFLPLGDPRRRLFEREQRTEQEASIATETTTSSSGSVFSSMQSATSPSSSSQPTTTTNLPPLFRPHEPPKPKRYHVTPPQILEMRSLRTADENTWTRSKLAEKFDCSIFFVNQVCQASDARRRMLQKKVDAIRTKVWGGKRRRARVERGRRRELWGRDE